MPRPLQPRGPPASAALSSLGQAGGSRQPAYDEDLHLPTVCSRIALAFEINAPRLCGSERDEPGLLLELRGERPDSNRRPPGPQPGALPTELRPPRRFNL